MKTYNDLVADVLPHINELYPWDIEEMLEQGKDFLLVDTRETDEYDYAHIQNSIHAPRGRLESCCDWGYTDTIPELATARDKTIVLICQSGRRSALATFTLQLMGYQSVYSMSTGIKGWNDNDMPLYDKDEKRVDGDEADEWFNRPPADAQMGDEPA